MGLNPILVIKTVENSTIGVRARLKDDFVEHEIVLNSVLAYYWANELPPAVKFLELFDSVVKRTINELMPHKNLYLKYSVKADSNLEDASMLEINLDEVMADDVGFKIDGKQLLLSGFKSVENEEGRVPFEKTFEKNIETPDIVLKKYEELKNKKE